MNNGTVAKGIGTSTPNEALSDFRDKVVEVKDAAVEVKDEVLKRGSATLESLRRMVVASPLKAVAIAFGIGYVGMRLTRPLRWL